MQQVQAGQHGSAVMKRLLAVRIKHFKRRHSHFGSQLWHGSLSLLFPPHVLLPSHFLCFRTSSQRLFVVVDSDQVDASGLANAQLEARKSILSGPGPRALQGGQILHRVPAIWERKMRSRSKYNDLT